MDANLTPELAQFIQAAVAGGAYPTESHALNEAVVLLQRRDQLRWLLEIGERQLDAGKGRPAAEVFARLEKRAIELDRVAAARKS